MSSYTSRWNSLEQTISDYLDSVPPAVPVLNRVGIFNGLLSCLQNFAGSLLHYFDQKFRVSDQISEKYPPEHVFSTILDQVSLDFSVMRRAIDQRTSWPQEAIDTLLRADKLAWDALQSGINLISANTTAITCFQRMPSIRIIPYARVALVGIPFTCISVPHDFLAIPHEVGHYVWQHGILDDQVLLEVIRNGIPASLDRPRRWLEEIFADIYGAMVGGPVIALDFQELQLRNNLHDFFSDDTVHPVPVLRPRIYTKVVERQFGGNWGAELDARWGNNPRVEGEASFNMLNNQPGLIDEVISAGVNLDGNTPVDRAIELVVQILQDDPGNVAWWHQSWAIATTLDTLNTSFTTALNQLDALVQAIPAANVHENDPDALIAEWDQQRPAQDSDPTWLPVFRAGGWATKGPGRITPPAD